MDTGLSDQLRNFYNQGVRRGYLSARTDKIGLRVFLLAAGWVCGVATGLGLTGWL